MTKKLTKALAITACAVLLVAATVMGTVAYLTSQATMSNTFAAGNVTITMDEAKTTAYGVLDGDARVTSNSYKLIPNVEYIKNATIYVEAGSEPCYLFVELDERFTRNNSILTATFATGWAALDGYPGIYVYSTTVDALAAKVEVPALASFKVKAEAKAADLTPYVTEGETKVNTTAYAVQAIGFNSAKEAWEATFGATQP